MAGLDFRVELDLGGGIMVPMALTEADISKSRNPAVRTLLEQGDRRAFRNAGLEIIRRAVIRNREEPLVVVVDEEAWIIPTSSIRMARFRDPTIKQGERAFGFTADRLEGN
ncbi:MAG TPA: hypothetical protein VF323_00675 [Candidatus Limnocylindrales bacterium]